MNNPAPGTQENRPTRGIRCLVAGLIGLALLAIGARLLLMGQTRLAGGDKLWRLTIEFALQAQGKATAVRIHPPFETSRLRLIQRNLQHPGFRIRNWSEGGAEQRSILAFARGKGRRVMKAEFVIHQIAAQPVAAPPKQTPLNNSEREIYLRDATSLQLTHPLLRQVLQSLTRQQPERSQLVNAIFQYLRRFNVSYGKDELNVPTTLAAHKASELDRSLAMVALCRAAGFPARLVTGLLLEENIEPRPRYWAEVYQDEKWLAYDIQAGYRATLPSNYLPLVRNGEDIVQVLNGELLQIDYDLEREFDHPYLRQLQGKTVFNILDLTRLPLDARHELAMLLLLPLGALITALCRHLVGLHSYGVFTPTLLALAMVYTEIITTAIIFVVVCTLAIAGRSLFPGSLTRIPRLAMIFTLVAMIMALSVSALDYFDLQQAGKIVLLPIIILTSLVDRLYRTIEDKGLQIAMRRLVWTILIALLCLPVIQFETLGQLLLQYPEAHFITLALFLLIATYKGKQLVHLPFIRLLAEPESSKAKPAGQRRANDDATDQQHAP